MDFWLGPLNCFKDSSVWKAEAEESEWDIAGFTGRRDCTSRNVHRLQRLEKSREQITPWTQICQQHESIESIFKFLTPTIMVVNLYLFKFVMYWEIIMFSSALICVEITLWYHLLCVQRTLLNICDVRVPENRILKLIWNVFYLTIFEWWHFWTRISWVTSSLFCTNSLNISSTAFWLPLFLLGSQMLMFLSFTQKEDFYFVLFFCFSLLLSTF